MDEEAAKKFLLGGAASGTNVLPPGTMPSAPPDIQRLGAVPQGTFEERNYRGVPIDMTEGLPATTRLGVEWRDRPEAKISYLEDTYGRGNVRQASDGILLIKIVGADNKPKEIPVSQKGPNIQDAPRAAAYIPETLAAMLAMRAGRSIPFVGSLGASEEAGLAARGAGFLRDVTTEAVGQEAGGAAKDLSVGESVQDAARERLGRIPLDAAIGAGLGVAGKVAGRAITPFSGEKAVMEQDLSAARKYFQDQYGIDFPLTAGERTGSSLLKRTESVMTKLPGSSAEFADIRTEKTDRLRRIMNRIAGLPEEASVAERAAIPSDEQVGANAIAAIRAKVEPTQRAIETAKSDLGQAANARIMAELEAAMGSADRQLYPEKVGQSIRAKAFALREQFQQESSQLYQDAYSLPGGSDRTLTAPSLPKNAKELLDAMPSKATTTEEISYDAYGSPVAKTREGREVLKEFVPANVAGKLQSLSTLKGEQFSLKDLVAMRTEVANDIAQGEAIPGVQTHYLTKVRDTLTTAIEEAADSMPDGNLKQAWQAANKNYADNVGKFHEGPVARMFKDIESRGFVADEDIIRGMGPTEYGAFKKFLGETSPEFTQVKRALVDELVQSATLPGETLIDGKAFVRELSNFYKKNRSIADNLFGPSSSGVGGNRGFNLQKLGEVLSDPDAFIDPAKFREVVAAGGPDVARNVLKLAQEQEKLTQAYRSQIVKDIGENKLGDSFDSSEFVNRFYKNASPDELRSVISQLQDNPEALEDLRRKVIEKVFYDAQRGIKDTDPSRLGRGELFRPTGSKEMDKVFGSEVNRERMQIALGNKTYGDMVELGKLLRAGEVTEQAFAGAGGLSAGMQVAKMLKGGVLSYAEDWVKQKFAAVALTTPGFRQWVGNTALTREDQAKLTRAFILSTPFVSSLDREFTTERGTEEFVDALNRSVGLYEKYGGKASGPTETPAQKEQRMRKLLMAQPTEPVRAKP